MPDLAGHAVDASDDRAVAHDRGGQTGAEVEIGQHEVPWRPDVAVGAERGGLDVVLHHDRAVEPFAQVAAQVDGLDSEVDGVPHGAVLGVDESRHAHPHAGDPLEAADRGGRLAGQRRGHVDHLRRTTAGDGATLRDDAVGVVEHEGGGLGAADVEAESHRRLTRSRGPVRSSTSAWATARDPP